MGALWAAGDVLRRDRLNRGVIVDRLFYPLYDEDQNGALTVAPVAIHGDDIETGETTHYTVPGSPVTLAALLSLRIANTITTRRQSALHLVPSGDSRAPENQIWADFAEVGNPVSIAGPWFLAPGDTLRSISADASASDIALTGVVLEFTEQPAGLTLVVADGELLTDTAATYYTVPGSGVLQALPVAITLCNQDTVPHVVTVRVVPSGQSTAARYTVHREVLSAKQTRILGLPLSLEPGDFLSMFADTDSVVAMRPTLLEVA